MTSTAATGGSAESDDPAGGESPAEAARVANRRAWTAVVFAAMGLTGVAMMIRGPIVPELGVVYGAPEWQLGLISPASTLGYLLAISVVGFGAGHVEPKRYVAAGLLGSGLFLTMMGAAPLLAVFLVATLARGALNGLIRGLNRPLLSHLYPDSRSRMYSYYDMVWAVGAMVGPVLVIGVLAVASWSLAYYALAAAMAGLGLVVLRLDAPQVETDEEPFDRGDIRGLLGRPEVLAMGLAIFFGAGVEGGLFLWLPTYVLAELPAGVAGGLSTQALSSLSLSGMIAGYVAGRAVHGHVAERVGYLRLLVALLALLVPAFLWTFVVADGLAILAGVVAIGALLSGVYPLLVSYATDAVPQHSGPVTAIGAVAGSLGIGIMPAVMGAVISGADAAAGMQLLIVPLVLALVVLLGARVAERRRERPAPA